MTDHDHGEDLFGTPYNPHKFLGGGDERRDEGLGDEAEAHPVLEQDSEAFQRATYRHFEESLQKYGSRLKEPEIVATCIQDAHDVMTEWGMNPVSLTASYVQLISEYLKLSAAESEQMLEKVTIALKNVQRDDLVEPPEVSAE